MEVDRDIGDLDLFSFCHDATLGFCRLKIARRLPTVCPDLAEDRDIGKSFLSIIKKNIT
jgi:hypothetical protein